MPAGSGGASEPKGSVRPESSDTLTMRAGTPPRAKAISCFPSPEKAAGTHPGLRPSKSRAGPPSTGTTSAPCVEGYTRGALDRDANRKTARTPGAGAAFEDAGDARAALRAGAVGGERPARQLIPVAADDEVAAAGTVSGAAGLVVDVAGIDVA